MRFPLLSLARQRQIIEMLNAVDVNIKELQRKANKQKTIESSVVSALFAPQAGDLGQLSYSPCSEVISLAGGFPISQADPDASGSYPIFGSSGFAGKGNRALSVGPTIVIGRVGEGGVGSVRYVQEPAWVTDNAL